jgi:hypothetical protein
MSLTNAHRRTGAATDRVLREKDDFYPTPPEATRALLLVETFEGEIWEPACGDGAISKELEAAGHQVRSSDLVDRGYGTAGIDFLMEWQSHTDNVITNPPYKLAEEFAYKALQFSKRKIAFLCKLSWLEGRRRRRLFESSPLARVWVFANRIRLQRGRLPTAADTGSGMFGFAWYVWECGYIGRPTIGWLPAKPDSLASYDLALRAMTHGNELS